MERGERTIFPRQGAADDALAHVVSIELIEIADEQGALFPVSGRGDRGGLRAAKLQVVFEISPLIGEAPTDGGRGAEETGGDSGERQEEARENFLCSLSCHFQAYKLDDAEAGNPEGGGENSRDNEQVDP